jgi:hypothetical protein
MQAETHSAGLSFATGGSLLSFQSGRASLRQSHTRPSGLGLALPDRPSKCKKRAYLLIA